MHPRHVLALAALMSLATTAAAAPEGFPTTKITLELREAPVDKVFALLGDISHTHMEMDACVKGETVDIKLVNTPISNVLDVLASKLGLVYRMVDSTVYVTCSPQAAEEEDARLDQKISLDVRDVPLSDVLDQVAKAAGRSSASCTGDCARRVSLSLTSVRVRTVLAVLADMSGLRVVAAKNVLRAEPVETH